MKTTMTQMFSDNAALIFLITTLIFTTVAPLLSQHYYKSLRGSLEFQHDDFFKSTPDDASPDVIVYILDTGIRGTHDMLKIARIERGWTSKSRCRSSPSPTDSSSSAYPRTMWGTQSNLDDEYGHGTFVASVVMSNAGGDDKNHETSVVPIRIIDKNSGLGELWALREGVTFAVHHHQRNHPRARAILLMSLSEKRFDVRPVSESKTPPPSRSIFRSPFTLIYEALLPDAMESAVNRAVQAGFAVFLAAGNYGVDICGKQGRFGEALLLPRMEERKTTTLAGGMMIVGGLDASNKNVADFSNHGNCVSLYAPAERLLGASGNGDGEKCRITGTSGSAAMVAGHFIRFLRERREDSSVTTRALMRDFLALRTLTSPASLTTLMTMDRDERERE